MISLTTCTGSTKDLGHVGLHCRPGVCIHRDRNVAWIREQPQFGTLIVVVLTSSNEPSDLSKCYSLGANSYLVKQPTPEQLNELAKTFKWYWLEWNRFPPDPPRGSVV